MSDAAKILAGTIIGTSLGLFGLVIFIVLLDLLGEIRHWIAQRRKFYLFLKYGRGKILTYEDLNREFNAVIANSR